MLEEAGDQGNPPRPADPGGAHPKFVWRHTLIETDAYYETPMLRLVKALAWAAVFLVLAALALAYGGRFA